MNRKNATRNALFTSILSLLLCVSMLVGTSFAWFTDSVSSGRNTITAGRLDIELYNDIQKNEDKKVGRETVLFDNIDGDLWEPGVVVWENLTVANVGNLALKYTLELKVLEQTTTTVEGTTYQLSDAIKVGVVANGITATDRSGVINAVTEWDTLTDFALNMNNLKLTADATKTFGIVLYWQPGDNDDIFNLNNDRLDGDALKLEIGVKLTANQVEEESDSFGEDYDADAGEVETEPDSTETPVQRLQAALNAGGEVKLNKDITLADGESLTVSKDVILNLGGYTITAAGDALVVTSGTLTLEGEGKVAAGESGVGSWNAVWADGGHVIINGGTYSVGGDTEVAGTDSTHQNDVIYTKNGGTAVINDGTFLNDGTVWTLNENDSNRNTITVYGGTFQGWNPADNVSEGANTNFVAEGYEATAETKSDGTWYTVKKASEEITLTAKITDDTYVTSNKPTDDNSGAYELSTNNAGNRTYFKVDFDGNKTAGATVKFTFAIAAGEVSETNAFTLKAFGDAASIPFSEITWDNVKADGKHSEKLGWSNRTALTPDISVENNTITITVNYSDIADYVDADGYVVFGFTSTTSGLKLASKENTEFAIPTVSVTYTPAAE